MRLFAVFVAVFALAGCPEPKEPPHLLYEQDAQSLDNPFPDLRLVSSRGFEVRPDWYKPFLMPKAATAKMREFFAAYGASAVQVKGVGNFGSTLLRVSEAVDPSTIGGTVARLRKTADGYEVLEAEVKVSHSRQALAGTGKEASEGFPEFLVVEPSVILPEGDEGLLVVKRGLKTAAGVAFGRGVSFDREKGSAERVKAAARALGVKEDEVLLTLPLKAEWVSPVFKALAEWTVSGQVPSFTIPAKAIIPDDPGTRPVGVWSAGDTDWNKLSPWLEKNAWGAPADLVGKVVVGTFQSRDLRENGTWKQEWVDAPLSAPAAELQFVLSVPAGPRPAGGWRVVLGGHGLGNRNSLKFNDPNAFCLELAQLLAKQGLACLGMDAPSHGSRGNQFDFFAIEDISKGRDNFRQMTFDQMQLSRTAAVIDIDADGTPDLAPEPGYFGNSLGGIMGGSFVPLDPRVKFGVLNVPGGGLSNILAGDDIRDRIGLLLVAKTGLTFGSPEYYSSFPIFRTVAQLFLETGDPVNVVQALPADKALLLQEGVGDLTIPNFTTEDLARAARIEASVTPAAGSTPLQVLFRADPANYLPAAKLPGYNGHGLFWDAAPVRAQSMKFLESKGTVFVVQ
ncbi:MAG: alpha/beta hydrolase family protein [Myxococcaceae bacterium]